MSVLALDVGTSSVRASLYGSDGEPIAARVARIPYGVDYRLDGGVETDPDALVARVEQAIDGALGSAGGAVAPPPVAAVGTSCFWHSLMGTDAGMHPVTPLLIWADTRSAPDVPELRRRLDAEAVRQRTGCRLHTSYPPAKLLWLRRARPEWWERARHWLSFGEYLTWRLTGELAASVSMASGSGLYDQRADRWDAEVLEAVGLTAAALPPLADLGQLGVRMRDAHRWPALETARVCLPAGDGACNNVGSGCMVGSRLALMIGTSGAVRRCRPGGPWDVPASLWQYRLDRRRGLVGGALSNGGNLYGWLRATLRLPGGDADVDAAIAEMEPGAHGLTFLPLLAGERSPGWAAEAVGAIVGLREATTPLQLARAGLEAVAQRFAALVADHGGAAEVIGSGGGVWHSPAWAQILADAIGVDLRRCAEAEPSSRGAALLALEAAGLLGDAAELPPPVSDVVPARPDRHEAYRRGWERQRRLYETLRADALIGFGAEGSTTGSERDSAQ